MISSELRSTLDGSPAATRERNFMLTLISGTWLSLNNHRSSRALYTASQQWDLLLLFFLNRSADCRELLF